VPNNPGDSPEQHLLLNHPLAQESRFRAADLVASVRRIKGLARVPIPEICVLDFDGDLTDAMVARGIARPFTEWPCFHTTMWHWESGEVACGIVARTIGGSYAVLVAEQLLVCGAKVIIGLTSAGRVSDRTPVPSVVVADKALRDEGTSFHYLPPSRTVEANRQLADALADSLSTEALPLVRGTVWTTDAPYRETAIQLNRYASEGVLAVEMQAASLFAFGQHHGFPVGLVAHVTNGSSDSENFDKGDRDTDYHLLQAICRGASRFLDTSRNARQ
jgi:uridine phosphorylase